MPSCLLPTIPPLRLTILQPAVRDQRYSCHACGNCCRDFTVQLREDDLRKLREQKWEERLGEEVTVTFRGETYLRQREDGACMFLMDDGRCRIHAEFGFTEKPIACQLFPFVPLPATDGVRVGLSFACSSVLANKGADLSSHSRELTRMVKHLPEMDENPIPPMLNDELRATRDEVKAVERHVDRWLAREDVELATKLDGLAWVAGMLGQAKLEKVREERFTELLDTLFGALPDELPHHPFAPATSRQKKLFRQAVFARTEDPKIGRVRKSGRIRTAVGQLLRSHRFAKGKGIAPVIGEEWPDDVDLARVEEVEAARDGSEARAIEELIIRYARVTILGGRAWGFGYYGWPVILGLKTLALNLACTSWLARLHAAGVGRDAIALEDVQAALGRIDRTAGRAKWLSTPTEKLRLKYLSMDDGLRRLLAAYALVAEE